MPPLFSAVTRQTARATRHTELCGSSQGRTVTGEFNAAPALPREKQRGEQYWFRASRRMTDYSDVTRLGKGGRQFGSYRLVV
jgi:hypothetical protein